MSDTTYSNPSSSETIAERKRLAQQAADEAAARLKMIEEEEERIREEEERRMNDPKERAKLFKNANDMIEAGIKEYEAKGYTVNVAFDENNLFAKIVFKIGKSRKTGTRGPRKKAGDEGHIPAMTRDQFAGIYSSLGKEFKNQNIVEALIKKFGENGKYTDFRTQPSLGSILANGYEGIKIEKVGSKGRNVYYKKIS